jgi:sugar (pentulose or hexulose) kinase
VVSDALLLGLDVGSTSCKAAVFDLVGAELAHASSPTPWRRAPTGATADPYALLDAARTAATEALALAPAGRVRGVGVASIAETGVLLDPHGTPCAPCIAWWDTRGDEEAAGLARALGAARFASTTGLPCTGLCSVAKVMWMRAHWPAARRATRWLNVAEWIAHALGADQVAELSLASRTGLLDLERAERWDDALEVADLPDDLLPPVASAGTPLGTVAPGTLDRAEGAIVTVAGLDHLAAAVGAGATAPGDVLDSSGTAEALVQTVPPLPPESVLAAVADGLTVGWHAVPGMALLGALRTGAQLQAVLAGLGVADGDRRALDEEARGARPVTPAAKAWRAAVDEAAVSAAALLDRMAARGGPRRRLFVTGGWAASGALLDAKVRHMGDFVHVPSRFTGARGAALAAAGALRECEVTV